MVDRSKLNFYSGDLIDKIIGIHSGTINVGAPTSSDGWLSVTDPFAHGFGDSAYFKGIFSSDNGVTWNDFGAQTPYLSGSVPAFQTLDLYGRVDGTNLSVQATSWYDNGNSRSQAYTAIYKVLLIAKNSMASAITPIATNEVLSLHSADNYQKIAFQGTEPVSVSSGNTGSYPVAHNLGYIPKVRAWYFDHTTPTTCTSLSPDSTNAIFAPIQTKVDTSNVTFYIDASSFGSQSTIGNIEYRIYYD